MTFWTKKSSVKYMTPPGNRFPEGDIFSLLTTMTTGKVFEYGCGDGRLSPAFDPDSYVGYDINPYALSKAQENNPDYTYVNEIETADTILAHTVLLHIPDDEIEATIELLKQYDHIVIGEIMGRRWRREGNPPVFNREVGEYLEMLGPMEMVVHPYKRYNTNITFLVR